MENEKSLLEKFADLFKPSPETIGKKQMVSSKNEVGEVDRQGNVIKKKPMQ